VGKLLALILVVLSLAAIALLVFRPALVIGASEDSLAHALQSDASALRSACDGADEQYKCVIEPVGRSEGVRYDVAVDNWGCWEATPVEGSPRDDDLSGCLTVADVIR
jgi:hypothetical protein